MISTATALGRVLQADGRNDEAEPILQDAVERTVAAQDAMRNAAISARVGLGLVLLERGAADAERLIREAIELSIQANGEGHWRTADARVALGLLLIRVQRPAEAEPVLADALETLHASPVRLPWLNDRAGRALAATRCAAEFQASAPGQR